MRTLSVPLALMAATALLAGCAGNGGGGGAEEGPEFDDLDLQATDSTGLIRGVVVDDAIRPIAGAKVVLNSERPAETETTADGLFGFSNLAPGTYFLSISKLGYFSAQQSTDVVAGVAEPAIVKVLLQTDAASLPFTELLTWNAFLQCGAALPGIGSANPCAVADSDNVHDFNFGGGRIPDYVQVEAYWEGTQPAGNFLSMGFYDPDGLLSDWKGVDGPSPLILAANATEIEDALGDSANGTTVRLFPGSGPNGDNPTVVLNQRYDIFVTHFYGFVPREGWSVVVDGPCALPEDCA